MKKWITGLLLSSVMGSTYADGFTLASPELETNKQMVKSLEFNGFGCNGDNISPALTWSGEPKNTKSFALTVYDPDAPTGSGWWHWVIINIPATVHKLQRNAGNNDSGKAPKGSQQTRTDFGVVGFGGACPPKGDKPHHYHFKLFALDTDKLDIPQGASAALVGFNLNSHVLGTAEIITLYQR